MSAKKVRMSSPGGAITNIDDTEDIFGNTSDVLEDEHTSAISDVFETDQEQDKKTVDASRAAAPSSTAAPAPPPPLNKEESRDATAAGSPSLEPEYASKSPSFVSEEMLSKSPSDGSFTGAYYQRKSRQPVAEQPKEVIDYSKPQNNVAVKYMKIHQAKIRQWRNYTLETLVNQQDCAVEAVKLETLLKIDIEDNKAGTQKKGKLVNPYELVTVKEKRRLYNLLKY